MTSTELERGSGAALTETAWEPNKELTYQEWAKAGRRIVAIARACQWWVGDWLNYGAEHFDGEKYDAAREALPFEFQTLRNWAYVAGRFEVSRRRDSLDWSYHAEVAGLEPADQDAWLDRVEAEGWRKSRLREELTEARRRVPPPPKPAGSPSGQAVGDDRGRVLEAHTAMVTFRYEGDEESTRSTLDVILDEARERGFVVVAQRIV